MGEWEGLKFAAGDVRGTRAFKVDKAGRLRGVVFEKIWRPGENVAVCLRGVRPEDVRPGSKTHSGGINVGSMGGMSSFGNAVLAAGGGVYVSGMGMSRCTCGCNQWLPVTGVESRPMPCVGGPAGEDCVCGFYAYQEGSNDFYDPDKNGSIGGVVRGYGKVVLCTRGFRAEKAEILALFVDLRALPTKQIIANSLIPRRLARNYDVPVFDDYLEMLEKFPVDDPEPGDDFWEAS